MSDTSYISDFDDTPNSIQYDLTYGSPIDSKKFIILHFNINSVLKDGRLDELQDVCRVLNVAVLVLTESKLDNTIPNSIIMLEGFYEPLRRDRQTNGRHGGGCLMYISEQLTYKHRTDLQSEYFEHLWADVKVGSSNFTITCFYRPPNESAADHDLFLDASEQILNNLSMHTTDNKIIASDLNFGNIYSKCPLLSPKPLDSSAPDLFARLGFTQLIDRPTRVTNDTSALIDLLFVQNEDLVTQFGTLPKIADHDGILVCLDAKREKITNKTKTIFDDKNANTEGLITFKKYIFMRSMFFLTKFCIKQNYIQKC